MKGEGGDLARDRESDREAGRRVSGPAGSSQRVPDATEKRRRGEGGQEGVDRPEVRELNGERTEGEEAGRDEGRFAPREAAGDQYTSQMVTTSKTPDRRPSDPIGSVVASAVERAARERG